MRHWTDPHTGKDYEVDANLKNDWLLRLNSLSTLKMTSNCEGHLGANNFNQKDHPILKFRLKEQFIDKMKTVCGKQQKEIDSIIDSNIDRLATEVRYGWDELRENVYFID